MAHKEVVKVLETVNQFQTELELAQSHHGVLVLDIFNAEWGHSKALNETFRRLFTDAGDDIYVRFFAVECNKVLDTLKHPDPHASPRKPPQREYHPDTSPQTWESLLEARQNHSKPFFLFYKEGKIRGHQEGIDTPKIYKFVRSLCMPQKPAAEYISNKSLMDFWLKYFSEVESEVTSNEFFISLVKERRSHREPNPQQMQAIEVFASASKGMITASGLQQWTGTRDFMTTVSAAWPDEDEVEEQPPSQVRVQRSATPPEKTGEVQQADTSPATENAAEQNTEQALIKPEGELQPIDEEAGGGEEMSQKEGTPEPVPVAEAGSDKQSAGGASQKEGTPEPVPVAEAGSDKQSAGGASQKEGTPEPVPVAEAGSDKQSAGGASQKEGTPEPVPVAEAGSDKQSAGGASQKEGTPEPTPVDKTSSVDGETNAGASQPDGSTEGKPVEAKSSNAEEEPAWLD